MGLKDEMFKEPTNVPDKYKYGVPEDNNDFKRENNDNVNSLRIRRENGELKSMGVHKYTCAKCKTTSWGAPSKRMLINEKTINKPNSRIHGTIIREYDEFCNWCGD